MRRIDYINKITTYAARFVLEVEGFNATNQYHINIHAENFLIPVLNEIFELDLENINATQKKNFPAIDLVDYKHRVTFQITATTTFEKIKRTLQTFFENKLDKYFDTLYFYIITEKKGKYPEDKLKEILPSEFHFNTNDYIIDKNVLLQRINAISATPKLELLAKLFEHEFSDVQIETRKSEFESGFLKSEPEDIFPNLLELSFPDKFYIANLNIDEKKITEEINERLQQSGKRRVNKIRAEKLINHVLKNSECYIRDWILHENSIYTLRDLHDLKEPLRQVIDVGTISAQNCKDYYQSNDHSKNIFRYLLRNTLIELCNGKGLQWFGEKKILRFANSRSMPNKKQVKWKGKNEATKTVIFEIINKKEGHIICYRSLAFRPSFECIGSKWFLVVNPTWSYTNPYGYKTSRFEPGYMSGIKRLENNSSVYNYFRFFGYHLTYSDLFTKPYPFLKLLLPFRLTIVPKLEEKTWRPAKLPEQSTPTVEVANDRDTELDKTLFD